MEWQAIKVVFDITQFLVIGGVSFYVYLTRRQQVTADRLQAFKDEVAQSLNGFGQRLTHLEGEVAHMPGHADLERIGARLAELHGAIEKVGGRLDGIGRAVDLMNRHLLDK